MSKPATIDAKDVEFRSIPLVVALSAVTLFIGYLIYLWYQWARELNGLRQESRHSPQLVLLLSIVTLGLAGIVYECIFAQELEQHFRAYGRPDSTPHLSTLVIALNVIAILFSLTGVGVFVAIPCGMAATCLVQAEINKLAAPAPAFVR
jgi:vacuolar-type H+-ATPase subunit I/STV1